MLGHRHGCGVCRRIWWIHRRLTIVGTQGPCSDAVCTHANGMVSTGSIHHSCLPGLFQQLSQRPGGGKESRKVHPGVKEESHINQTQRGLNKVLLWYYLSPSAKYSHGLYFNSYTCRHIWKKWKSDYPRLQKQTQVKFKTEEEEMKSTGLWMFAKREHQSFIKYKVTSHLAIFHCLMPLNKYSLFETGTKAGKGLPACRISSSCKQELALCSVGNGFR